MALYKCTYDKKTHYKPILFKRIRHSCEKDIIEALNAAQCGSLPEDEALSSISMTQMAELSEARYCLLCS